MHGAFFVSALCVGGLIYEKGKNSPREGSVMKVNWEKKARAAHERLTDFGVHLAAIVGSPCSGKGHFKATLGRVLATERVPLLGCSDILREAAQAGSWLNDAERAELQHLRDLMKRGVLCPDDVVNALVLEKVARCSDDGVIGPCRTALVEGFPRSVRQAEFANGRIRRMVVMDITTELLQRNIQLRLKDSGRGEDNDQDTILRRVRDYNKTLPDILRVVPTKVVRRVDPRLYENDRSRAVIVALDLPPSEKAILLGALAT